LSGAIDYEAEYDNRARVPGHPAIIEGWARDAAAYRAVARAELGVPYGDGGERDRMDLFLPEGGGDGAPIAMFIHGGYWQALDRSYFSHAARGLNARGFVGAVPSYELCPAISVPVIVDRMRLAALALWERFGRRLVVTGHSAGGHLAACLAATPWGTLRPGTPDDLVAVVYGLSGLYDLPPLVGTSVNRALGLIGATAREASPLNWPAPIGAKVVAAVGGEEPGEYHRQSAALAERWGRAGASTRYESLPGRNHFTIIAPLAEPGSAMVEDIVGLAGR